MSTKAKLLRCYSQVNILLCLIMTSVATTAALSFYVDLHPDEPKLRLVSGMVLILIAGAAAFFSPVYVHVKKSSRASAYMSMTFATLSALVLSQVVVI